MQDFLVLITVQGGVADVAEEPVNGVKVVVIDYDNFDAMDPAEAGELAQEYINALTEEPEHAQIEAVQRAVLELRRYVDEGQYN